MPQLSGETTAFKALGPFLGACTFQLIWTPSGQPMVSIIPVSMLSRF